MEKLLIIDDALGILRVLKMRLESEGYQVEAALVSGVFMR
jgi:CheY-like chemotaxis protein